MLTTPAYSGRFSYPTAVLFAPGAARSAGPEIARLGRRALIVTDPGLTAGGVIAPITAALEGAGVAVAVYDGVHPNPTEGDVRAGLRALAAHDADVIVAVGGGSALDAAKIIRLMEAHPFPIADYDARHGGDARVTGPLKPLVAMPTTAGTGSEVSRSSVISLAPDGRKIVVFSPRLIPTLAVCDPELSVSLPPRLTAATGADALTHAVEAYLARGFHPPADALALQAVTYVFRYLRRACLTPGDLEARAYMLLASMMGAMAFQKGLGACHAMAHALTAVHHLHHGLANAICLPVVADFNRPAVNGRLRDLVRAAGLDVVPLSDGDAALHFFAELRALFADVGLPASLRAAGVAKPDLDALVALAKEDGCLADNPVDLSPAQLRALFLSIAG